MIAVIACFQLAADILVRHLLRIGQPVKLILKVGMYFLFGDAAELDIKVVHRDIIQVVQVAEYAYFTILCNPCQYRKLDVAVHGFEHTVERFQCRSESLLQLYVTDGLKHRFVVLVDKDGNTFAAFFAGTADNSGKPQGERGFRRTGFIKFLPLFQCVVEDFIQTLRCIILLDIQIKMQHGPFYPIFFKLFDGQAFKQFLLSFEISLKGGDHQTFAETARATEEVVTACFHQPV